MSKDITSIDDFSDHLNAQTDKRKIEKLMDEGIIDPDDLANAPIYLVEPNCSCGSGLEPDSENTLRCPTCRKEGTSTYDKRHNPSTKAG